MISPALTGNSTFRCSTDISGVELRCGSPPSVSCSSLMRCTGAASPIWPSTTAQLALALGARASSGRGGRARRGGATPAPAPGRTWSKACGQRGLKWQPLGGCQQRRRHAGDRRQAVPAVAVDARDRAEQAPGVGVLRVVEELVERALLDHPARVHDHDAVGDVGDHREVVGDQDDPGVGLLAQLAQLVEDLRLDRDVQRRGRLVGDQQLRRAGQRHRDHHALAHAAGELVRVGAQSLGGARDADALHQLDGLRHRVGLADLRVVRADLLDDLPADPVDGVQRADRILEDHRDVIAADLAQLLVRGGQQLLAVELGAAGDACVGAARQAHQRHAGDGLARARTHRRPRRPRRG